MSDPQAEEAVSIPGLEGDERQKAAALIQRAYRGHRTRRQLNGCGLDAGTRWYEAIRDAQYQHLTDPTIPTAAENDRDAAQDDEQNAARSKWIRATKIAQRAGADDFSISETSGEETESDEALVKRTNTQEKTTSAKGKQKKTGKMMDLQYFLEMVDQKHRYGSNLRKYHAHWKAQDTNENFFYWLDHGTGKDVSLTECSRARLNKMQVRYLSREERLNYLVKVDDGGRLVWAKNGERVWTKDELYKDSIQGIVPTSDPTPAFKYNVKQDDSSSEEDQTSSDEVDNTASDDGEQYANEEFHRARGPKKLKYVSTAVFFNHMVRKSLKKGHKWIFVSDTSFRMYIGYKQSGAFQHSSFLHGSRIAAAGVIKVKNGQLRSLAPLSGHYRPPTATFRAFVHSLQEQGVDMSRVSISKSYAVLVGMEGYTKTSKRVKAAEGTLLHEADKIFRPEKAKEDEEKQYDPSESARKERLHLEQQRIEQTQKQRNTPLLQRWSARLSRAFRRSPDKKHGFSESRGVGGTGPEDGIPPPEGHR